MELKFRVQTKVLRPIAEVFDAVVDPKKLSAYFTTGGSSGRLEAGKTVQWTFQDGGAPMTVPVQVKSVTPPTRIVLAWAASEGSYDAKTGTMPTPGGYDTTVEMTFEELGPRATLVVITEGSWRSTPGGLAGSYGNCEGWSHMTAFLKAYLEHGINLRAGAY